jgi:uncharacterized RDD family membrane protein YckC
MGSALDTEVAIETPEHIVFQHRVAGPARRALAHLLDLAICYGVVLALGLLLVLAIGRGSVAPTATASGRAGLGVLLLVLFAVQWVYFVAWEGLLGRSPGKMALGIRVVTGDGRPVGFGAAALRNLLRAADLLPTAYVAGIVAMALSSRFQRIGDLVAGTMVVTEELERSSQGSGAATALVLSPPATATELRRLPDEVSLDAEERAAIELFLRRRPSLGLARQAELASMIADRLGARVGASHDDPARLLALIHHRAVEDGRSVAPPSLRPPRGGR